MRDQYWIGAVILISAFATLGAETQQVPLGRKVETEGVIMRRSGDEFLLRTHAGNEYQVRLGPFTEIKEKKKNPFRGADQYGLEELVPGLNLRVEGRGAPDGALLADQVRFTRDERKVAQTIASRVKPVEEQLSSTRQELASTRSELQASLEQTDAKAVRLEQEVEELDEAFRLARQEAGAARQVAEAARSEAGAAHRRIDSLDEYREVERVGVTFAFNSHALSDEARRQLDEVAARASGIPGSLIEVAGFASADGDAEYNKQLSNRRAEAVVDYLVTEAGIPLRRIVRPWGFGENQPVADNATLEGRRRNRRVEVRVLQSQGLAPAPQAIATSAAKSNTGN